MHMAEIRNGNDEVCCEMVKHGMDMPRKSADRRDTVCNVMEQ